MINGIITKGIGGFYYVMTDDGLIECRARGLFREENLKPLIGDKVDIRISSEDNTGYIEKIYPRTSELIRPTVANITQIIIVMSIEDPKINPWLLDRFIMMAEKEKLKIVICINKFELNEEKASEIERAYKLAGFDVFKTSTFENVGVDDLKTYLKGEMTAFAGPSGVGKSSLLNLIGEEVDLEVGDISKKTGRGKHTTRHVELMALDKDTYVLDTPGFSSLDLRFIEDKTDIKKYFREIDKYGKTCKFQSCLHENEPNCNIKKMVEAGEISQLRYDNYLYFLNEYKNIKKY